MDLSVAISQLGVHGGLRTDSSGLKSVPETDSAQQGVHDEEFRTAGHPGGVSVRVRFFFKHGALVGLG